MVRIYHSSSRSIKTAGGHTPTPALTLVLLHMKYIHQSWYSHLWLFVYSTAALHNGIWIALDYNMPETLDLFSVNTHESHFQAPAPHTSMLFCCYPAKLICLLQKHIVMHCCSSYRHGFDVVVFNLIGIIFIVVTIFFLLPFMIWAVLMLHLLCCWLLTSVSVQCRHGELHLQIVNCDS